MSHGCLGFGPPGGAPGPARYKRVHPFLNGHHDDPGFYQKAYEGYVRYSDAMFGRLVDGLRASPHWDDTLLIVTADHGTLLDPANPSPYALGKVHEDITHVALLIRAPGQAAALHHWLKQELLPH